MLKRYAGAVIGCLIFLTVLFSHMVAEAKSEGANVLSDLAIDNQNKLELQIRQIEREVSMQSKAKEAYNKLQNVLSDKENISEKYAGAYIDNQNNLVVGLTTADWKLKDELLNLTGKDKVVVEKKPYSYEQLLSVYHMITENMRNNRYSGAVSHVYVDEIDNKVVVETTDISLKETIKKDVIDKECIEFKKPEAQVMATKTYLKPGGDIEDDEGCYSIGWRGWRINNAGKRTEGLVTAGHGVTLHAVAKTSGGNQYGKFVLKRFGGKLDMSFVQRTNNNYGETNTIKFSGSSLKAGYYVRNTSMVVGQKVYKVGMTTKLTAGKILSLDDTYILSGYKEVFSDCVKADYKSGDGDSGGLVYMDVDGAYRIAGNTVAAEDDNKGRCISSDFIKAENIVKGANVFPY